MPAGRPPKGGKDKATRGTLRKSRVRKSAINSPTDTARLPNHLEGEARAAWLTLSPILRQSGMLTINYAPAFEQMCGSWARCRTLQKLLDKDGMTYCSPVLDSRGRVVLDDDGRPCLGMVRMRPEVQALQSETKIFRTWLAAFGLTPADVGRVDGAPPAEEAAPGAELMDP